MYRLIAEDTWDDPWFAELEPRAKLLFLYCISNRRSTACGCFEITKRAISFETGLDITEVDDVLTLLTARVTWWPDHQIIFVKNFYKHQSRRSQPDNFRKGAIRALAELPRDVQVCVTDVYPELVGDDGIPSPSDPQGIPNPTPIPSVKDKDKDKVLDKDDDKDSCAPDKPARAQTNYPADFQEFWKQYPPGRGSKQQAYVEWKRLRPDEGMCSAILEGLAIARSSSQWEEPQYIPYAERFLKRRIWENPPLQNGKTPMTTKAATWQRKQDELLAIANGEEAK